MSTTPSPSWVDLLLPVPTTDLIPYLILQRTNSNVVDLVSVGTGWDRGKLLPPKSAGNLTYVCIIFSLGIFFLKLRYQDKAMHPVRVRSGYGRNSGSG
jgi:hypothetical protein